MGNMHGPSASWLDVPWPSMLDGRGAESGHRSRCAVVQVDAADAGVRCLQVGDDAVLVEDLVVGVQQRGAGALVLQVRADGEDGQVRVYEARIRGRPRSSPRTRSAAANGSTGFCAIR